MEAMWTRCNPLIRRLQQLASSGELGEVRQVRADLGFVVDRPPTDRLMDPALGAGALLDMGIYPLTVAHLFLGEAEELHAVASLSEGGIDLDVALTGRYPGGALATMTASMTSWSSRAAALATDRGRIDLDDFHHPTRATFTPYAEGGSNDVDARREPVHVVGDEPVIGRGYGNEIAEVVRCLRAGLRESPLVPHAQTVALMRQMDDVRAQIGVRYAVDDR
jgi:predicted dehydrogenase